MPIEPPLGRLRPDLRPLALALAGTLASAQALAGATVSFGPDKSISIGLGLRASLTHTEDGAPSGNDDLDINLDSMRLYLGGSLNKYVKATFNTEKDANDDIKLLDAIARFEFDDRLNVWVGRMLPPSDRANLDGPYYLSAWYYPGVVSQYPAKFAGRDNGLTVWGRLADKKLTYALGAFRGHNKIAGASNADGNLLYALRLQYNFFDPEPNPAYYTSSTYYGSARVLALAFAGMYQSDGVGSATNKGDYQAWNVDALFEQKLAGGGVLTLEGAYYDYDTDDKTDVATNFGGAGPTDNVGGLNQGDGWLAGVAYLIPTKLGWGRLQPHFRYQTFDADLTNVTSKQYDYGVNYVINGHNTRMSLTYSKSEATGAADTDRIVLGVQLQF